MNEMEYGLWCLTVTPLFVSGCFLWGENKFISIILFFISFILTICVFLDLIKKFKSFINDND
jgi:hypothetical protein